MQEASMLTICPSFNCYSSIATKVSEELNDKTVHFGFQEEENEDGFEFDSVFTDPEALTISADEMFSNGKIRPIFPIFQSEDCKVVKSTTTRHTLIKLMNEEREPSTSSSFSSESESEEAVPGTFCVWKPKSNQISSEKKKSSSKRWKLKDLIQYGNNNNNESKESVVVLAPFPKSIKKEQKKIAGKLTGGEVVAVKSAHELHYVRNRELKEVDKRRSYLPYRKDLVGFFLLT
ncbi:Histone-lysine N-methyltransferase, H3 lysine-79 specific like [Thalictrum thalictroides]|uniref:Histone-lysine N-methyltransferase, H3 lysine-79 specific like n=1 Tax=Thalictrum thalictroides TaxID=46969 RepID=A0A7J6W386_THATH|nr:Histone-lysine N-methyltransferase, H3 lysine-79 specific like [Thalictrum thalictroides]